MVQADRNHRIGEAYRLWDNTRMTLTNLPQPHEQRKVETLLIKLAKVQPISAKPAPIAYGKNAVRASAHPRVFYST